MTAAIEKLAVYVANLFFLTSDTSAPVLKDKDLTEEIAGQLLCSHLMNLFICSLIDKHVIFMP